MKSVVSTFLLLLTLSIVSAQTTEQYIVSSPTLNMRSGAGKQYKVIATLSKGDSVTLIEKSNNGWLYVDFEGAPGYVFSQFLDKDPYSGWEKRKYQSGVAPECENVKPQYDYKLDNYLRINVGSGTDVVVKIMKVDYSGDECIRVVYVRSNDTYEIKNIPEGEYYLKIAYGKDYRQKIVDNQCYVKFIKSAQYEKGSETLDYKKIKQPNQTIGNDIYENWSVPSFELYLDVIVTNEIKSSFKSSDISEAEFNK